ncbi:MAG: hypothetical protein PHP25_04165 [Candidatus Moranbacteria bacterium]|nr:hypothetical protein [Candidatus Moranbacteria bacterium]
MNIIAVLFVFVTVFSGCADSRVSRPDPRFENFYDRSIGDNIFSDALSGFTPTAVGGFIADQFFSPQPTEEPTRAK